MSNKHVTWLDDDDENEFNDAFRKMFSELQPVQTPMPTRRDEEKEITQEEHEALRQLRDFARFNGIEHVLDSLLSKLSNSDKKG